MLGCFRHLTEHLLRNNLGLRVQKYQIYDEHFDEILYYYNQIDRGVTRDPNFQFDNSTTQNFSVTPGKNSTNSTKFWPKSSFFVRGRRFFAWQTGWKIRQRPGWRVTNDQSSTSTGTRVMRDCPFDCNSTVYCTQLLEVPSRGVYFGKKIN
jgi:hypothetical protein